MRFTIKICNFSRDLQDPILGKGGKIEIVNKRLQGDSRRHLDYAVDLLCSGYSSGYSIRYGI
jgi:hypothetical protein